MAKFRGFAAAGVVAAFTEPTPAIGEQWRDIDAPCNAPAKNPLAHLDKVAFHSRFYNYELALPPQNITITHAAVANEVTTWGFSGILERTVVGGVASRELVLLNHGLPYTPLVMVAYGRAMVVTGTLVQDQAEGRRFVSAWANGTSVGLGEAAYGDGVELPAVNRTYQVWVFRTPAPDPSKRLFSGGREKFQMARGMIDSAKRYLRRENGAVPFNMDFGRTVDISGGGARVVTGGISQSDAHYNGGFAGGGYQPVSV